MNTNMWVLDSESNKIVDHNITYMPGLFKIFDEIVVNAIDKKQRNHSMGKLEITNKKSDKAYKSEEPPKTEGAPEAPAAFTPVATKKKCMGVAKIRRKMLQD